MCGSHDGGPSPVALGRDTLQVNMGLSHSNLPSLKWSKEGGGMMSRIVMICRLVIVLPHSPYIFADTLVRKVLEQFQFPKGTQCEH